MVRRLTVSSAWEYAASISGGAELLVGAPLRWTVTFAVFTETDLDGVFDTFHTDPLPSRTERQQPRLDNG